MKSRLSIAGLAMLLGFVVFGQNPTQTIDIDDTGTVNQNKAIHVKEGQVLAWRHATGSKTWYVAFTGATPCAAATNSKGGKEFGHDRALTCRIATGTAGKTFHYRSALAANSQQHDPDVIVDP